MIPSETTRPAYPRAVLTVKKGTVHHAAPARKLPHGDRRAQGWPGLQFPPPIRIMPYRMMPRERPPLVEVMGFMSDKIDTLLKEGRVIQPSARTKAAAHIPDYDRAYKASIADPEAFWGGVAKELEWFTPWTRVLEWNYPWPAPHLTNKRN